MPEAPVPEAPVLKAPVCRGLLPSPPPEDMFAELAFEASTEPMPAADALLLGSLSTAEFTAKVLRALVFAAKPDPLPAADVLLLGSLSTAETTAAVESLPTWPALAPCPRAIPFPAEVFLSALDDRKAV